MPPIPRQQKLAELAAALRRAAELVAELAAEPAVEVEVARPSEPDRLIDDRELAAMLGVSRETCQRWRHQGEGPPFEKIGARVVRYRVSTVQTWIKSGRPLRRAA